MLVAEVTVILTVFGVYFSKHECQFWGSGKLKIFPIEINCDLILYLQEFIDTRSFSGVLCPWKLGEDLIRNYNL